MRVVIQRVNSASVLIEGHVKSSIGKGLLILVGFETSDEAHDLSWMCNKLCSIRIFNDDEGLMNKSIRDVAGDMLVVSQFTLFASTKKGNRPSFIRAAKPNVAIPLYEEFIRLLEAEIGKKVYTGLFGADMKVNLENNGPVTIIIDTKEKD